jgi:hypothetical protein
MGTMELDPALTGAASSLVCYRADMAELLLCCWPCVLLIDQQCGLLTSQHSRETLLAVQIIFIVFITFLK